MSNDAVVNALVAEFERQKPAISTAYLDDLGLLSVDGEYDVRALAKAAVSAQGLHHFDSVNADLLAAIRKGVEMRRLQKVYFQFRTREALIASKQAEAEFDRMAQEALKE